MYTMYPKKSKYKVSKDLTHGTCKCVRMYQKVKILLWKMYILRRRHWIITLLEVFVPCIVFGLVILFRNMLPDKQYLVVDASMKNYSNYHFSGNYKIAYTPSNNFTDSIMKLVASNLTNSGCQVKILVSKHSEQEIEDFLKAEFLNDSPHLNKNYSSYMSFPKGIGVIFLNTTDTDHLKYKLRTTRVNLKTEEESLYGQKNGYNLYLYDFSGFTTVQASIDQVYMSIFQNISISDPIKIRKLPYVEYTVVNLVQMLLATVISIGFTFIMPSLLREIVGEKSSGIKEMMRIMGLKPWMNWVGWLVYSLMVYVPVTCILSVSLTYDSGSGPAIDANFFIIWFLFLMFTLSFLTLLLFMSTFFQDGTIAMIVGELIWYGTTILLDLLVVKSPDDYNFFIKLLTCLWPSISLIWGLRVFNNFHKNEKIWTVRNLFDDGVGGGRISVGLAVIMLIIDFFLYSVLTWYMDNVRPGPYGRSKPPTFIFQIYKKKDYDTGPVGENSKSQQNYEPIPQHTKVGIHIEDLQKSFNKGKVMAIQGVNIDICESHITVLLGHNGAGKTSLMSILAGFFSPTRGKVIVKGKNIFEHIDQFRSTLGLCPQHNLVFSYFTVKEHLIFFGMLKGFSMRQAKEKGETLLKAMKMYDKRNEVVKNLSGGMKRKVSLCIALIGDPLVLLLDEPTSGMDPESRRQVWDMLLASRGQRTTIITTHFMEEADVLGDRVAIMNQGQVTCYGTPMFLKRLYGTGYNLNISKKEEAPEDPITGVVKKYVSSAQLKLNSSLLLIYKIESEESPHMSSLFESLDVRKTELGLTHISISCSSMEDVFLIVTAEPEDNKSIIKEVEKSEWTPHKVTRRKHMLLQLWALIYKKILIIKRSWFTTLIILVVPVLTMAASVNRMMDRNYSPTQPVLLIDLASFPKTEVAVSSDNKTLSSIMKEIIISGEATYKSIPLQTSLESYLEERINASLTDYEKSMIAGFEFKSNVSIGGYSNNFDHSSALVLNMIANALLRLYNSSSDITVYNHPIPVNTKEDICDISVSAPEQIANFPQNMIFVSLGLMIIAMGFIPFPLRERVTNSKRLQIMTGVSPILYWLVIFLLDLMIYSVSVAFMIISVFFFEKNNVLSYSGYSDILVLVLMLYGISGIPFAYLFSFFSDSSVKAAVSFAITNLAVGTYAGCFVAILDSTYSYYGVWRFLLSFNPLFSATSALIHLFTIMYINGACLQCGKDCNTQNPFEFLQGGLYTDHPHGINNFLIFLAFESVLYISLVLLIEFGFLQKIYFIVSRLWIKQDKIYFEEDQDVRNERDTVLSLLKLQGFITNDSSILQVHDLGKKYSRKITAVYGVTFQVGQGECFGLLGVNGAGKTTTFKMLTCEEIPDKGDAFILNHSLRRKKSKFLSHVGYCPQFDAIIPSLTGREMLNIYALLRGIPKNYCKSEVSRWIKIIGLEKYAERKCGTYSGGNKRKLSTAMAFIGFPSVVFLDEPTTGVDPRSRRKLWNIVSDCQKTGQAIVLTSHSMEECEALCTRLTVMVAGHMECIGSPQYLKGKFGQGYTIKIKLNMFFHQINALNKLKNDVTIQFKNCTMKDEHLGLLHYHIPDPSVSLSFLFSAMEDLKKKHYIIEDYVVSDATLEEVFMSFATQDESL